MPSLVCSMLLITAVKHLEATAEKLCIRTQAFLFILCRCYPFLAYVFFLKKFCIFIANKVKEML